MRRRRAFTIVELLVAMALIVLIMAILAEAFAAALESFRQLKAIGDMQERMRVATNHLRLDLLGRHFEGDRKLSQFGNTARPQQGFFRIQQNSPAVLEGVDDDGLPSTRAAPGCVLHFAVHQIGGSRESYYTARIPPPVAPNSTTLVPVKPVVIAMRWLVRSATSGSAAAAPALAQKSAAMTIHRNRLIRRACSARRGRSVSR